jgi:pantoate--beta-alanine ligase
MSSRNRYLTDEEFITAAELNRSLERLRAALLSQENHYEALINERFHLSEQGFNLDYLEVVTLPDMEVPSAVDSGSLLESELAVIVAAKLGSTRLIDNILVNIQR